LNHNGLVFQVLKDYYINDLTQQEIALKFNITRVAVSRLLSKARKEGMIEFKIKYPKDFSNPRLEHLEKEFIVRYDLKECIIVQTQKDWFGTLKELSNQLAGLLDRIVTNNTFIGVGWGTTLETISKYIELKEKKGVRVTPLIGGYGKFFDDAHSNNIARIIAEKLNGTSYVVNIPASFDTKEIKESILADSTAKEIFKRTKMTELAVLCMSDLGKDSSLYKRGQITDEDIYYLEKLGVIGDINYLFVDKDGNIVPNDVSDRVANIFPIELMQSVKTGIGIATGKKKANIVRAVLKAGIINTLITDSEAAFKVVEIENTED
jgi:deoxyribonucleoside regulator